MTCSEWVAGMRVVLIWGEWTEVTGLELRAQGNKRHNPTPAAHNMLLQQHFPFSSLLSLSLIVLYLPLHPTAPSTYISSSSHPRPSRQGHKKFIWSVSHVAFCSNVVRVSRFHRLLHQYWEQSNKCSAFSCLQCGCYASDSLKLTRHHKISPL